MSKRLDLILLAVGLCFCMTCYAESSDANLCIHFIDVGMGDAILLLQTYKDQQHAMIIDTGDIGYSDTVAKYVRNQGVRKLEIMVLTHPHSDHIGGAYQLLNTMPVDTLYMTNVEADTSVYSRVIDRAKDAGVNIVYPQVGDTFGFGDAMFTVYAPHPILFSSANDWSLVLMMEYHGFRVLFTGDAEYESESYMLDDASLDLDADILKVGHHGSQTSTSYAFAQAVSPTYAIISCGLSNVKEYPDVEVGMNLMDAGVETILTTSKHGTIIIRIDSRITLVD